MTDNLRLKFTENWQKNHSQFGQTPWEQEADFCYFIECPLPLQTAHGLHGLAQKFKHDFKLEDGTWLEPEAMHLTLTLPGRLGTHFQKNDVAFMKKTLAAITAETPAFELRLENFNVFPSTLWAEVHDSTGRLQQLHEALCNEIPFSQHPEFRYAHFLPHISVAYGVHIKDALASDTDRHFLPLTFSLDTLCLGKAKWQGAELTKEKSAEYTLKSS
jgi:2'-5' RNA ligase